MTGNLKVGSVYIFVYWFLNSVKKKSNLFASNGRSRSERFGSSASWQYWTGARRLTERVCCDHFLFEKKKFLKRERIRRLWSGCWWNFLLISVELCVVVQCRQTITQHPIPNEEFGAKWLERHVTCGLEICRKTSVRIEYESTSKGECSISHNLSRSTFFLFYCNLFRFRKFRVFKWKKYFGVETFYENSKRTYCIILGLIRIAFVTYFDLNFIFKILINLILGKYIIST